MKKILSLLSVALIAGAVTLGGYKYFIEAPYTTMLPQQESPTFIPANFNAASAAMNAGLDFTDAAEKTVNSVVHVQNTTISTRPANMMEYFSGRATSREMVGTGSGVIISPDGYIITNNHVIENASELSVTLNNNRTYPAEIVGADAKTDIALIKLESEETFPFVTFGDSDEVRIGEWVLAVGNPFNLTSTVTAGIVSAKARDLNEFDGNPQSFIQTDAAVNRGNSGGALVNTRGELIGINTAITSETGSYVGYAFAVPSNNARKVIEDIMEFGDVQRGILGITGGNLNSVNAEKLGTNETEGVYVNSIERGSGADVGGIEEGDIIKELDGIKITKFSDLTGYLGSKRPNDVVNVTVLRNGRTRQMPVTLIKLETFEIPDLGIEVRNASQADLETYGLEHAVKIEKTLTKGMAQFDLAGNLITKINDIDVKNIDDVKRVMSRRNYEEPIKVTFVDRRGDLNSFIFR